MHTYIYISIYIHIYILYIQYICIYISEHNQSAQNLPISFDRGR